MTEEAMTDPVAEAPDGTREFVAFAVEYLVLTLGEDHPTIRAGRRIIATLDAERQPSLERLADALRRVDVLEGYSWESQVPKGWRHRKLAEDILRALSPSSKGAKP